MVSRLILLLLLAALAGCSSLLFYPMTPWVQNPANQGLDYKDVVLIHPKGLRLHGWWLPAEGMPRGTVYYLHGNAQNISTHLANVQWLPGRGYNVFLLDYRGYGLSEGKPRLPAVFADVQLGLDWLHQQQPAGLPLVVFGQSLGAAMASRVLGDPDNANKGNCVVLEASFASYRGITSEVMAGSWLLWPFRWMVTPTMPPREADPEQWVAGIAPRPLLLMHSEDDQIIPYAHGQRLYQAAAEPKQFQRLRGPHIASMRDSKVQDRLVDFLAGQGCRAEPESAPEPVNGGLIERPRPPEQYQF